MRTLPAMPDAARDHGVRADHAVVADLDLVVELHAVLDHGVVERAAVDGGVGADLDVVADAHRAHLRDLHPAARVGRHAEAVGADHHARVQDAAVADGAVVVDRDARVQARVVADAHVGARRRSPRRWRCARRCARRGRSRRRRRSRAVRATMASGSICAVGCMPGFTARRRVEERHRARVVRVGIVGDDARQRGGLALVGAEDHGAGARRARAARGT